MDFSGTHLPCRWKVCWHLSRTLHKSFYRMIYGLAGRKPVLRWSTSGGWKFRCPVWLQVPWSPRGNPSSGMCSSFLCRCFWTGTRLPPAARSCFESPFSSSFSRNVGIVRYWHQILLIKSFKYIFIKEAFSLLLHGEEHASVWPEHLHFEMFCPYRLTCIHRCPQKLWQMFHLVFGRSSLFTRKAFELLYDSGRYLIPHSILHHRLFTGKV